ncbi:CmpA/NrtA family ABC transporter substrate-binding protein [Neogemmobacter tilapiae]|uniref:Nitrate transporter n=1 Tax=Neogemmobacter tilapiae TaxID=875041 RepID=A0A918WQF9_9RHOB|nr:CmpA/NrtA family ABC transporter substrate-binding protein [Gemmobacter tilapiae]GHC64457.1 nitrate transporter [Gemmobacter tilapiae]
MTQDRLALGFIPLVDAAPLIVAEELGFAAEEGLSLNLRAAASWSMLRDMLDFGQVVAAQMLSVVPVARALALGGGTQQLEALMVLSMNGQVFGVSAEIGQALGDLPFGDPLAAGKRLAGLGRDLRIGVPFPFSMHTELLDYWLPRAAPDLRFALRTVPPPRMAEALKAGEIDGFCVGEPWGSHAVALAGARLVVSGAAIWSQAPEKVLATRAGWAEEQPDRAGRLMRAVWRAGRWAATPQNRTTLAELLARPEYLNVAPDLIDRALTGRLLVNSAGPEIEAPQFQSFDQGAASFPWRSQAAWIADRLAQRYGLRLADAHNRARATFRSDLYRLHLGPAGAALPRSSEKAEGVLNQSETVPGVTTTLILPRNRFFDGQIFDPADPL